MATINKALAFDGDEVTQHDFNFKTQNTALKDNTKIFTNSLLFGLLLISQLGLSVIVLCVAFGILN